MLLLGQGAHIISDCFLICLIAYWPKALPQLLPQLLQCSSQRHKHFILSEDGGVCTQHSFGEQLLGCIYLHVFVFIYDCSYRSHLEQYVHALFIDCMSCSVTGKKVGLFCSFGGLIFVPPKIVLSKLYMLLELLHHAASMFSPLATTLHPSPPPPPSSSPAQQTFLPSPYIPHHLHTAVTMPSAPPPALAPTSPPSCMHQQRLTE